MPEIAIDKDGDTPRADDDVWAAKNVFGVQPIADTTSVKLAAKQQLS